MSGLWHRLRRWFGRAGATPAHEPERGSFLPAGPWQATHQHRKGGLYRELARGIAEADRAAVVIYDDPEGTIWVRVAAEFDDGRFTPVGPP